MRLSTTREALAFCALVALAGPAPAQLNGTKAEAMPGAEASDLARPAQPRADAAAMPGDAVLSAGREVFVNLAEPQCAVCHTLDEAGSEGAIGPNLDELKPTAAQVHAAVTGGVGVMPAYEGVLTDEQIDAVSIYVATVTGAEIALPD